MGRKLLFILFILLSNTLFLKAQSLNFRWGGHFRGLGSALAEGVVVYEAETDSLGNVYCLASLIGSADLNPFSPTASFTSTGSRDLAIIKLSSQGNYLWAKTIDSIGGEAEDLHIDHDGNLIIVGSFEGYVDFDPSSSTNALQSNLNQSDGFVLKLDPNGNFIWVKQLGGTGSVNPNEVVSDKNNKLYIVGGYGSTIDFDPGVGIVNRTTIRFQSFLLGLDGNGIFLSVNTFQSSDYNSAYSIDIDNNKNIVISGYFKGSVDFNWSSSSVANKTSNGNSDIYILKLDSNHNYLWNATMGGIDIDEAYKSRFDQLGNVYTGGTFNDLVDLDPSTSTLNYFSTGNTDFFFQKLDPMGNLIWVNVLSAGTGKEIADLKTDKNGNIYATGLFSGSLNFGQFPLTAPSRIDHFCCRINSNGSFDWVDQIVTASTYVLGGSAVAVDAFDNLFSFGNITGNPGGGSTFDINPSPTSVFNLSVGYLKFDSYVRKLGLCTQRGIDSTISCGPFTWIDGNTYSSSINTPTYRINGGGSNGCDSVVTLNLVVTNGNINKIDTIVNCGSYTWIDGNTYSTNNNTAIFTYSNVRPNGCDSIVTLNLTILPIPNSNELITACDSFIWVNGVTYTNSNNTATFTYPNAAINGCDSIVSLDLTINNVSSTATNVSGISINAINSNANYQWLDCNNNHSPLLGDTNQTFIANQNGNYAVELRENGCIDTSSCIPILSVNLLEVSQNINLSVSPNPFKETIQIHLEKTLQNVDLEIRNITGQLIISKQFSHLKNTNITLDQAPGVYFLILKNVNKQKVLKLIKE